MPLLSEATMTGEEMVALCRKHSIYEWSVQTKVDPIPVARAQGIHFWTPEGKRFIDFNSQLMCSNIGHSHPKVVKAIQEQAATLCYANPFMATEPRARLGAKLAEIAPGDIDTFFFTNGGAEAVENAIRVARVVTGRHKVMVRYRAYHGGTAGAITLTGDPRRWASEPGIPGVVRAPDFHKYGRRDPEPVASALAEIEDVIRYEGGANIAAFIMETVVGTNGILIPPDGYMQGVREICDRHGILLICDEVMCGFGRTGRWFAVEHDGALPDIVTFGKGIGGGVIPLSGMVATRTVREVVGSSPTGFSYGHTFSGYPLGCAVGCAVIDTIEDEGLVAGAAGKGERIRGELERMASAHPMMAALRGRGLLRGIELRHPVTGERFAESERISGRVARAARERGLMIYSCPTPIVNRHMDAVMLAPPLIISDAEIDEMLEKLEASIGAVESAL
jgi:taurine---2-oxoglutarate transaminase